MRRFLATISGITIAMLAVAGCSLFVSLDDLTGGSAGDASDEVSQCSDNACDGSTITDGASSDGEAGPAIEAGPCDEAGASGPSMVLAAGFCIDSTEVTVKNYADFLAAGFSGAQPSACAWNADFHPDTTGLDDSDCTTGNVDPSTHGDFPISCIDWCDARAYCEWAGKALCGDSDGGALPFGSAVSGGAEWYAACSAGGKQTYSTGSSYDGGCNTSPSPGAIAVASDTTCVGGYPGLFDMAGNVEEWIDSCDNAGSSSDAGPTHDNCHEGGDCFNYINIAAARCDNDDQDHRGGHFADVGVRCCAPLP